MPLGREDMKKVRRKLRWFTFIVVLVAGVNSYFSGSIAESGGINVTGLSGAFATAVFVFLAILIFISIPFNVLAFLVVHSNRYPLQGFQTVSRVLTWFMVVVSLLLGIYCYFAGITAGTLKVTGIGGAIYAIIFVMIVMSIVVAIPTHVVAFIVFAIRGPSDGKKPVAPQKQRIQPPGPEQQEVPDFPPQAEEIDRIFQQQRNTPPPPDVQALLRARNKTELKELLSQIGHTGNKVLYGCAVASAWAAEFGLSEEEAKKDAAEWSEIFGKASKNVEVATADFDQFILHKQKQKDIPELMRVGLKAWQLRLQGES